MLVKKPKNTALQKVGAYVILPIVWMFHILLLNIEDPESDKAYNLDHINMLAKVFECKISDLLPTYPLD